MKLISNAHQDGHAALLQLLNESHEIHKLWLDKAIKNHEAARKAVLEHYALPWYKRFFVMFAPSSMEEQWWVNSERRALKFIEKVIERAQYELTIELNNDEADVLFRKPPKTDKDEALS